MKNEIFVIGVLDCEHCGSPIIFARLSWDTTFEVHLSDIIRTCPSHYSAFLTGFITVEEMLKRVLIDWGKLDSSLQLVVKE